MRDFGSPLFSLLSDSGQRRDATCGRGGATHATPPFLEILPRLSPLPPSRILPFSPEFLELKRLGTLSTMMYAH